MFEHFTDSNSGQDQDYYSVMTSLSHLLSSRAPLTPNGLSDALPLFRYGMPSLFTPLCNMDAVCSELKAAILHFEPRLKKISINVDNQPDKAISITIEGWLTVDDQSTPIKYVLK